MNIPRLLELKQLILDHPRNFHMQVWAMDSTANLVRDWTYPVSLPISKRGRLQTFACGTAACLAGHAVLQFGDWESIEKNTDWNTTFSEVAAELLDLTEEQSKRLFLMAHWPSLLRCQYNDLSDDPDETERHRAKVAAARIDLFISTDGKE